MTDELAEAVAESLAAVYSVTWASEVEKTVFGPPDHHRLASVQNAYDIIREESAYQLPSGLVPLAIVDERSVACVVVDHLEELHLDPGEVVRWHLDDVPERHQATRLDLDPLLFVKSLEEELAARKQGLSRILDEIGPAYEASHIAKGKRPRDHIVRPVRIACQNVIVGLAAISQDSSFDGLSVVAWQTCEVPHVATHEGNRALAALTLCDAFQNGGTMEIRFDRQAGVSVKGKWKKFDGHPEGRVPASLRRFGRTVGVALGVEHEAAISPAEARELFMAITPMPPDLRNRVDVAIETRGISPERICFMLLSQVWREIELDFILATSRRAPSILKGGSEWADRLDRQAESEVCRAAMMIGMLYRRLNSQDAAGAADENGVVAEDNVRVVEDRTRGISWQVDERFGAVEFSGLDAMVPMPWTHGVDGRHSIRVFPRSVISDGLLSTLEHTESDGLIAVLLPRDAPQPTLPPGIIVLRCPDRLADIDKSIEDRLLKSRISRE